MTRWVMHSSSPSRVVATACWANGRDFDILREAVLATGLDRALSGRRQLTVFAPPDQAFLDLTGAATEGDAFAAVASLGLDAVADVLAYHVMPGRRTAADVVPAERIRTPQVAS